LDQEAVGALANSGVLAGDFSLGDPEEYRNDLAQPDLIHQIQGAPVSKSTTIIKAEAKQDPEGPATQDQWTKHAKMVA